MAISGSSGKLTKPNFLKSHSWQSAFISLLSLTQLESYPVVLSGISPP